jgi:hypothetical protein
VAWLRTTYWKNNQKRIKEIEARQKAVADEAATRGQGSVQMTKASSWRDVMLD